MQASAVCACFDGCFASGGTGGKPTRMVLGADEPLYVPAARLQPVAEVVAARGLAQSCLHEAAHWLYAGPQRRQLTDYGYWYVPDGRDAEQQRLFERVETRVQGLEWILSLCAGVRFHVSADNLIDPTPSAAFRRDIADDARQRLQRGLHNRARVFAQALAQQSGRVMPVAADLPDVAPV